MKTIILIGRPNVGKSSLFNRLAGRRLAITSDVAGTTRDTNRAKINIDDKECVIVDSGGLDESSQLWRAVKANSLQAAADADIIIFMVDGKLYPDELDKKIFYELQRLKKSIALVINKIDSKKDEMRAKEFISFGAKCVFELSVSHNSGTDELLAWLYPLLGEAKIKEQEQDFDEFLDNLDEDGRYIGASDENSDEQSSDDIAELREILRENDEIAPDEDYANKDIKVGIVGRVNVGKSSLLNALVKKQRSVVSEIDGTTIDPVNEKIKVDCFYGKSNEQTRTFEFIDTAGIRRRGKIDGIEKYALNRTQKILENADIALLILDASEGINELDERIAGLAAKHELGVIIVLNKWDKITGDEKAFDKISLEIRDRFKFLAYASIISISALGGKRVHKVYDLILSVYENYTRKLQTSRLNEVLQKAQIKHPAPREHGRVVKIYYGVQFGYAPPRIALICNKPRSLHFSYMRYLQNQIRENFELNGSPIVLIPKNKSKDERN